MFYEIINDKNILLTSGVGFYNIRWVEDENYNDVLVVSYAVSHNGVVTEYHNQEVNRKWFNELRSKYATLSMFKGVRYETIVPVLKQVA
ncbi:hypothetical protein OMZ99_001048 [Escherichia coli]|nr:hypothetical protein [Escherichia coli]HBD4590972.1 hypothetical protein [Shigella sonnei]HBD6759237.1 hypothetical protein [Shigella sonnei]HCM8577961.1 hypothetical protein [Shigella boydii]